MNRKEPASLSAVKLRRGPRRAQPGTKAGDITAQLLPAPVILPPLPPSRPVPAAPKMAPAPSLASPPEEATAPQPQITAAPEMATPVPIAVEIGLVLREEAGRGTRTASAAESEVAAAPPKAPDYWEFIDYWNRLRRDRPIPALTLLDRELVAESWPDSLMVTYSTIDAPMPQIARLSRPTGEIEYSPMVTEWIISCAREVARHGEAMEDEQEFPLAGGTTGYRLLLLPFAGAQGESDHVLCHLSRARKEQASRL